MTKEVLIKLRVGKRTLRIKIVPICFPCEVLSLFTEKKRFTEGLKTMNRPQQRTVQNSLKLFAKFATTFPLIYEPSLLVEPSLPSTRKRFQSHQL